MCDGRSGPILTDNCPNGRAFYTKTLGIAPPPLGTEVHLNHSINEELCTSNPNCSVVDFFETFDVNSDNLRRVFIRHPDRLSFLVRTSAEILDSLRSESSAIEEDFSFPVGDNTELEKFDFVKDGVINNNDLISYGWTFEYFMLGLSNSMSIIFMYADSMDIEDSERLRKYGFEIFDIYRQLFPRLHKSYPEITKVTLSDGSVLDLTKYRGKKTVIIHHWATFCVPCVSELPRIAGFQRDFDSDVVLIMLSYDNLEDREKAHDKLHEYFPEDSNVVEAMANNNAELLRSLNILGIHMPYTHIFGKDGKIKLEAHGCMPWPEHGKELLDK